jgi:hypothetical protein
VDFTESFMASVKVHTGGHAKSSRQFSIEVKNEAQMREWLGSMPAIADRR